MSTPIEYQQALIDAGTVCAQSAAGAISAAMVVAHLAAPPAGMEQPAKNLNDAAALASTAAQAAAAVYDLAQALDLLQARPLKAAEGTPPPVYPTV